MAHELAAAVSNSVVLSTVRTGQAVRVREMRGGRAFLSRLASLGFTPGARLRMIQNYGRGPLIVVIRDTRVALGRGEAGQIVVEPAGGGDDVVPR